MHVLLTVQGIALEVWLSRRAAQKSAMRISRVWLANFTTGI